MTEIEEMLLDMKCPVCHRGELKMIYKVTKIPHFGGILVMSIRCSECGFRVNDIYAISEKGNLPETHTVKSESNKLGDLVVLSAGSKVEIPELGYEMVVMDEKGGEITTVEGILRDAVEAAETLFVPSSESERAILREFIDSLKREIEKPSGRFTIKVFDPNRRSAIIPVELWSKKVEVERLAQLHLSDEYLKRLGKEAVMKKLKSERLEMA